MHAAVATKRQSGANAPFTARRLRRRQLARLLAAARRTPAPRTHRLLRDRRHRGECPVHGPFGAPPAGNGQIRALILHFHVGEARVAVELVLPFPGCNLRDGHRGPGLHQEQASSQVGLISLGTAGGTELGLARAWQIGEEGVRLQIRRSGRAEGPAAGEGCRSPGRIGEEGHSPRGNPGDLPGRQRDRAIALVHQDIGYGDDAAGRIDGKVLLYRHHGLARREGERTRGHDQHVALEGNRVRTAVHRGYGWPVPQGLRARPKGSAEFRRSRRLGNEHVVAGQGKGHDARTVLAVHREDA